MVPKKNRLDIGKCNGKIPHVLKPKEETFQVVLDALALTPCYPVFIITADVPKGCDFDALPSEEDTLSFLRDLGHIGVINSLNDVVIDQMHQPWRTFAAIINRSLSGKTSDLTYQIDNKVYKKQEKMYYPRFTKVIIHDFLIQDKTLSWRNKITMHNSKDDYLINTLRFVSRKEASQIYGAVQPECLTSPEMKESKAYKTYLGHATGVVPPKIARKFKKVSPSKKDSIVFRETLVKTKSTGKEKVDVSCGKSIHLLSAVALAEKAQLKEITPTITSEGTGDKLGVPDVTEDDSIKSESESWGNDEDDNNNEQESSNEGSEQENESKEKESDLEQDEESYDDNQEEEEVDQENESEDVEIESDEDNGMDDTTDQFDDDVDARLEEPTQTGKEVFQGEGADVEMNEAQQGNENLETTQEQVVDDAHVTITTTKKIEVPVTSFSRSSDLAYKFLNFSDITHTDAEIVSPLDVHVYHEVLRTQAPTLLTIPILPKEVSNFASLVIEKLIKESRDEVTLAKVSSQAQSTYEVASILIEFELKKILLDKMDKSKSYLTAPEHRDCYDGLKKSYALDKYFFYSYDVYSLKHGRKDKDKDEDPSARSDRGLKKRNLSKDAEPTTSPKMKDSTSGSSKGTKSQPKSSGKSVQSEELVFEVANSDMSQDQEGNLGDNEDKPRNETTSRRDWFKKPTPPQEPTNPDWNIGKTT
ncbi:hypothetical protein Tco_0098147 [Tanacetum coccineum]